MGDVIAFRPPQRRVSKGAPHIVGGYVLATPAGRQPYKAVLLCDAGTIVAEHAVATMREGEALIRARSTAPAPPMKMRGVLCAPIAAPPPFPWGRGGGGD